MQKRLLCLLSVLLVGCLLVGCVAPQKEAKGKTEEKEKIGYPVREWEWYENKEWGFKIKYPVDANISEMEEGDFLILFSLGSHKELWHNNEGFRCIIHIYPKRYKTVNESARIFVEEGLLTRNKRDENFTLEEIKVSNLTIDKMDARRVAIISKKYDLRSREVMYFIIKDDKEYGIDFLIAPPEKYDKFSEVSDKMIGSFKFI
jgi:hypothetical protein